MRKAKTKKVIKKLMPCYFKAWKIEIKEKMAKESLAIYVCRNYERADVQKWFIHNMGWIYGIQNFNDFSHNHHVKITFEPVWITHEERTELEEEEVDKCDF